MFRSVAAFLLAGLSFSLWNAAAFGPALARSVAASEPTRKSPRHADAPLVLVAPFSPAEAKERQTAWANHLKTEVQITNSIGTILVLIPAGEFQMGSHESMDAAAAFAVRMGNSVAKGGSDKDEYPQHRVKLTRPFFLGMHEVRRGEFRKFVEETGYRTEAESDGKGGLGYNTVSQKVEQRPEYTWKNPGWDQTDNHPVINVSWADAVKFCEWLGKREGSTYQLPTEAQWEFACRAGTTGRLVTGDMPEDLAGSANVGDQSLHRIPGFNQGLGYFRFDDGAGFTSAVGRYRKNPIGLCDMHGNVWEWCSDWYGDDYYASSPSEDPAGPSSGSFHVYRGGGWLNDPVGCRSSRRGGPSPSTRCNRLGFRVVRVAASSGGLSKTQTERK